MRLALILSFFVLSFFSQKTYATHFWAGEIVVEVIDASRSLYRVRIKVFTNSEPADPVLFGDGELNLGGGSIIMVPIVNNNSRVFANPDGTVGRVEAIDSSDLPSGVSTAEYIITHTFPLGISTIGYTETNRNDGIINIDGSVNVAMHLETVFINQPVSIGPNNSPQFLISPTDRGCVGHAFFHNPGAYDPDGIDSLTYELVVPKSEAGVNVSGYKFPGEISDSNENGGDPIFKIDPLTGEVTWDAPRFVGEYVIAIAVREFRLSEGIWVPLGYVIRDMQIVIEDCDNGRPTTEKVENTCVEAGSRLVEVINGFDPDNDKVKIEAFSEVFDRGAEVNLQEFQPSPGALNFEWQTDCNDVRAKPYAVNFKISDQPEFGPSMVDFEQWSVSVVGTKPMINRVQLNSNALLIEWDNYFCDNAETMELYRRVGSNPYKSTKCETGIRKNSGYEFIASIDDLGVTSYRDTDLSPAAKYCYRIYAKFPEPLGGESIVSDEVCFEFIPAEKPVITNVSIVDTDDENGIVDVSWHVPLEFGSLTAPFTYNVYRSVGFSGMDNRTLVETVVNSQVDGFITIQDKELNTKDNVYNYDIVLDKPGSSDLVSSSASTVRLEAKPQFRKIRLDWEADVPWSNYIFTFPGSQHEIYKGIEGETLSMLASVDVNEMGLSYIDNDVDLEKRYCYQVKTQGTYENPEIQSPFINFSQIICAQPSAIASVDQKAAESEIRFYPNPVTDKLIIETGYLTKISLYAINGAEIEIPKARKGDFTVLDMTSLEEGSYFIHLVKTDDKQVIRIVKRR